MYHSSSFLMLRFARWLSLPTMIMAASPKGPDMQRTSVSSDGSLNSEGVEKLTVTEDDVEKPMENLLFENTEVLEINQVDWHLVEGRVESKIAYAINFYTPGKATCVLVRDGFVAWAKKPQEYKIKVAAVNCDHNPDLCKAQDVQHTPQMKLYPPYEFEDAPPEFYNGIINEESPGAWADWAKERMHALRSEKNRRKAVTMIRREDKWTFDVGDENEKLACSIHAARNLAIMIHLGHSEKSPTDNMPLADAEGLHDHPLKDLWGFSPDINGQPAEGELSGPCKKPGDWLRQALAGGGTMTVFANVFKLLVQEAFDIMLAPDLRWWPEDPYSLLLLKTNAPSLQGGKVLRLCTGLGDEAPTEIWVACLGNEGRTVMSNYVEETVEL